MASAGGPGFFPRIDSQEAFDVPFVLSSACIQLQQDQVRRWHDQQGQVANAGRPRTTPAMFLQRHQEVLAIMTTTQGFGFQFRMRVIGETLVVSTRVFIKKR
jgi:hypothetical protein